MIFQEECSYDEVMAKSVMENVTSGRQTITDSFNKTAMINKVIVHNYCLMDPLSSAYRDANR